MPRYAKRPTWWIFGLAAFLLVAVAERPRAAESVTLDDWLDFDTEDSGISHVECTYFGKERERVMLSTPAGQRMAAQRRAEQSAQVLGLLPRGGLDGRIRSIPEAVAGNYDGLDKFIFDKMAAENIQPAGTSTDAEFLRRVTLDLTGRVPTVEEAAAFLQDNSADKRASAVDRLLATGAWADKWAMFFGDLYRNTRVTAQVNRYPNGRDSLHIWLRDSLRDNKGYDQMAKELIQGYGTSDGRVYPQSYATYDEYIRTRDDYSGNPVRASTAGYIVGARTTGGPIHDTHDTMAVNVARDFLGIGHMDCILCHDGQGHLDSLSLWGKDAQRSEGWSLAAYFSEVRLARPRRCRPGSSRPCEIPVRPNGQLAPIPQYWYALIRAAVGYPLNTDTGNRPARAAWANNDEPVVHPWYPFNGGAGVSGGADVRASLGDALAADPQFARAAVNYIWAAFFSRGIVDPPDQMDIARLDASNPPPGEWEIQASHPELLDYLAAEFAASGFDLKHLMRTIANSAVYQLSSRYDGAWNSRYEAYFARFPIRRLSAEEVHDAVILSTGDNTNFATGCGVPPVRFAMQFPDVRDVPRPLMRCGTTVHRTRTRAEANQSANLLDSFFRGDRDQTQRSSEGSILQALQLMNSPFVVARVNRGGLVSEAQALGDQQLVERLYLAILSRVATEDEMALAVQRLQTGDRTQQTADLAWSLYNKVDFIFNY